MAALRAGNARVAGARMIFAGVLILGQVFTRYDGWIVGAVVWACFAWAIWKSSADLRKRVLPVFIVFTVLCAGWTAAVVLVQPPF